MFGGVYIGTVCHWIMNYTNMYGYSENVTQCQATKFDELRPLPQC